VPFASKAQRGYLFAHNPKVAKEFAAATPKGARLPEHVKPKKKGILAQHFGGMK
jgi:hypothetical protein